MKKLFLCVFILCVTWGLAACGREEPPARLAALPTPEPTPNVVNRFGPTIPAFDPDDRNLVEIEFWHIFSGTQLDALHELIEAFHISQPYVRVNEVYKGTYEELREQININERTGTLPHLSLALPSDVTRYRAERIILPLSPFMNAPVIGITPAKINDIASVFHTSSIYDGTWYSMPFAKHINVLFYNLQLFNAHNLTPPATWAELQQAARTLTIPGVRAGMGFVGSFDSEWLSMLIQHGGEFIDETTNRAVFSTPEGIRSMDFLLGMINSPYARIIEDGDLQVAMFFASVADRPASLVWDSVPVPGLIRSRASEVTGFDFILLENVSHGINERVGAWEFIRFTLEAENAGAWAAANGFVPVTHSATTSSAYNRFLIFNPHAKAASLSMEFGFVRTRNESAEIIQSILSEEFNDIKTGASSIEDGLAKAEQRINDILANNR